MLLQDLVRSPALPGSPAADLARSLAAAILRRFSRALADLAARLLQSVEPAQTGDPVLEFYAEAGAPEGALYLDGRLVARLPGVKRL